MPANQKTVVILIIALILVSGTIVVPAEEDAFTLSSLGEACRKEGDYKKARAAAEKSLQCYPHNMNTKAMIAFLNAKHR